VRIFFDFFKKYIDAGDFVGTEGEIFKQKQERFPYLLKK